MQKEQIKTLLINIATVTAVAGGVVGAYFIFAGKSPAGPGSGAQMAGTATPSAAVDGAEIARMVTLLENLGDSVAKSAEIFRLSAFKDLQDLSTEVPPEAVGRENPFVPTDWNIKIKTFEEEARTGGVSGSRKQNSVAPQTQITTKDGLMGDFDSDAL